MQNQEMGIKRKVILIGGTGNIGKHINKLLIDNDFEVHILSRSPKHTSKEGVFYHLWNPLNPIFDQHVWENVYAVINLAGESVGGSAWTIERKNAIRDSRVKNTNTLSTFLTSNKIVLPRYIGASAIGYYGDNGQKVCHVADPAGTDFLAEVCSEWENAHLSVPAEQTSIIRIGVVLDKNSGALQEMLKTLPFFISLPGPGTQILSWIHMIDLSTIFLHLLTVEKMIPIFNGVAPQPLSMENFIKELKAVFKPISGVFPVPAVVLKSVLGEMSQIVIFSHNCSSQELLDDHFEFLYPALPKALQELSGH